jgi:hypothetical protein
MDDGQALDRGFTEIDSTAGQLPFLALVERQADFASRGKENAFDGNRIHGRVRRDRA